MSNRLLRADTRLTAEHILRMHASIHNVPLQRGISDAVDLTIVCDMALRELSASKEVERLEELVGKMHIGHVRADAELKTLEEKLACDRAILKARTEEMNKAHHKLDRVKRVLRLYKGRHKEASDKLDLDEEGWQQLGG